MSDTTTKKVPSERDQRIYWEVRGRFRTQRDVAREFEMTQPRVCQIVRDVAAHFARTMPGLDLRLSRADELALVSRECVERRQRLFARAEEEYEASKRPLVTTIEKRMVGDEEWDQRIERGQRGDVRLLKIMQQENDRLASWAEKKSIANCKLQSANCKVRDDNLQFAIESATDPTTAGQASSGTLSLPIPPRIRPEDREKWPMLSPSEQERAAKQLAIHSNFPLDWAKLDIHSPEYVFYPHRSEGEMSSCGLAQAVVEGGLTPAEYVQMLEHAELSKPLVCPLALAADEVGAACRAAPAGELGLDEPADAEPTCSSGPPRRGGPTWRVKERDELRPPSPLAQALLDEGKHAADLDAATQAELYQPHLSRAAYYAAIRREMLGEGMLSPDEFASLSVWASRLPGGLPAEGVTEDGHLINAAGDTGILPVSARSSGSTVTAEPTALADDVRSIRQAEHWQDASATRAIANCEVQTANCEVGDENSLQFAIPTLQFAMDSSTRPTTAGPASSGTPGAARQAAPTSARERLLAAGKPLSDRTRARWERKIERRRARTLDTSTGCPRGVESAR